MGTGIWGHAHGTGYVPGIDLVGYKVEATDGSIGKVDKHTEDVGRSYVVVDTGPWIFGRRVLIPAGLIVRVDAEDETVHLSCTRDHVKDSPDFAKHEREDEPTFVTMIENYYTNPHTGPHM
ncbi:PRC-barrel domain-containing protein [Streptomyces sp. RerS4]|uniref:PRC-barrel domain-containing protein n=1 Tax=Streptomyces sp. RerS4 TaxID=2942449 RepID=UPI00201C42EC|nr:PRC-barrel domain-containing protein [Streptomyces sp. RerS4]UQW99688.1 PRC-barrel domain-containing protein [Streptomyces sp. RerS4]